MAFDWDEHITRTGLTTVLTCSKCKHSIPLQDSKNSVLIFCPKCRQVHSKVNEKYNTSKMEAVMKLQPVLVIGAQGELNGIKYKVIGCAEKYMKGDIQVRWHEYMLLAEDGSVASLALSDGHWTFMKALKSEEAEKINEAYEGFAYEGRDYKHFASYHMRTQAGIGEFAYDVIDVRNAKTKEYISPPYLLAFETNGNEKTVYFGEYKKPKVIAAAFDKFDGAFPNTEGIGACQPFPLGINPKLFIALNGFFLFILLVIYGLYATSVPNKDLFSIHVPVDDTSNHQMTISPSFELTDRTNLLHIKTDCPLENEWIETNMVLVDELLGQERSYSAGLEYYSGYDSEGGWNEGETTRDDYMNNIEAGKYHFEINIFGEGKHRFKRLNLEAETNRPMDWNFLLVALFIIGLCLIIGFANRSFENSRYGIGSDDDE